MELDLYRNIITETLGFLRHRIQEIKLKQILVNSINEEVGMRIDHILKEEQNFYL